MVDRLAEKESLGKHEVEELFADVPKRASRGEAVSKPRRKASEAAAAAVEKPFETQPQTFRPSPEKQPRPRTGGAEPAPA